MGSIGNYSFIQMTGAPVPEARYGIEVISRVYVDGIGYRVAARKGEPTIRNTTAGFATQAQAFAAEAAYKALIGYKLTVVEDVGKINTNVLVVSVSQVVCQRCVNSTDASVGWIVTAVWELMLTG